MPLIINGQVANPGDYPVSFQVALRPDLVCTWFLVSSQTLVGASHCLDATMSVNIEAIVDEPTGSTKHKFEGPCVVPTGLARDPSQDWALCLISPPYPLPRGPRIPVSGYENLNVDADEVVTSAQVEIGGYGCDAENAPVVSTYLIGKASITTVPPAVHVPGLTVSMPNFIELRQAPAILCQGDSGGPAFVYSGRSRIFRTVIGINSKTAIAIGRSYLASTSTEQAKKFFKDWATTNGQKLCGVHPDAQGCRPSRR